MCFRRAARLCSSILLLVALGCGPPGPDFLYPGRVERPIPEGTPPPGPAVIPAEWEPAVGAVIRWPLRIPEELAREIARDDRLFVLVRPEQLEKARGALLALGIAADSMELIASSVESPYPRDYGPHQIFDGEGQFAVLDHVFAGWPLYPDHWQSGQDKEPEWSYWDGPGDDDVPLDVARHLEIPVYRFPGYLTGGNFLVDGHGTAFATEAQVDENLPLFTPDEFRGALVEYTGIERLHVLANTEALGIQHIDTWLKVLDPERLLLMRPPAGHPEEARIDRSLAKLAGLTGPFGRPYEILRIEAAEMVDDFGEEDELDDSWPDETGTAPYTNSLILNRKVLVPLFGLSTDEAALETWRQVMPGYEVIGFPYDRWASFDALHCRVRPVFDGAMLRISHPRLLSRTPHAEGGFKIEAWIDDKSGAGLLNEELLVMHRAVGASEWRSAQIRPAGNEDRYEAVIDPYAIGTEVEYYLQAADQSGRRETLPRTAPQGTFRFSVIAVETE
jgi:agmatine/peptidylarginine deiminase